MDSGLGLALALSLPAFCVLVAAVGLLSIKYLTKPRLTRKQMKKVDELLNITAALDALVTSQPKTYKLTTSPRLDMTKAGTTGLTVYSVNGRICKCFVNPVTK